jgi:hypothetical protein
MFEWFKIEGDKYLKELGYYWNISGIIMQEIT